MTFFSKPPGEGVPQENLQYLVASLGMMRQRVNTLRALNSSPPLIQADEVLGRCETCIRDEAARSFAPETRLNF